VARESKGITLPIIYKADLSGIKKSEGALKNFGKLAAGIGAAAIGAVTGVAIAGIKAFGEFDSKLQQSVSIMGDVSDAMRDDMANAAREVAKATTFSASEAAESYFFLASAGLDAEASIAALPKVAAFAQAGMFDMALATDLLTDAQSALGLSSDDAAENLENMSQLADVLVKANTLANASVEQFSAALTNKAAASMRTLNMDMEEGVAVLAVFADQGLKGEAAGTAFNATMLGLTKNARDNASAFEALGVQVFDSTGELNSMADIVAQMEDGLDGMSTEQVEATLAGLGFSKQALDGTKALLGNSEALREYEEELRNAGGTVDEVAGKQLETFTAQMELMKSLFEDIGIEVGSVLVPILVDLLQEMGPVIEEIGGAVAEAFVEMAPVIRDIAQQVPGLVQAFIPLIPAIASIAALFLELVAMALPMFVDLMDELLPIILELAPFIADFLVEAFEALMPVFMELIRALMPIVKALLPVILGLIVALAPVVIRLVEAFMPLIERILPLVIQWIEFLIPIIVWLAELIGKILVGAVDIMVTAFENTMKFFENFGETFKEIWKNIQNFFAGIVNGMIGMFEGFVNGVIRGLNALIRGLNAIKFDIPSWVPVLGGKKFSLNVPTLSELQIPRVPMLAEGGIVDRATLAVIGEAGPEAVVPLDKLGAMGGPTYNIVVNAGLGTNGAEVGREIVAAIKRYERSSGRVFASA
jgi:TP901 family phage tail tape measure protein